MPSLHTGLDLRTFVWVIHCFWCDCLIPDRPEPVCQSCREQLEDWPIDEGED